VWPSVQQWAPRRKNGMLGMGQDKWLLRQKKTQNPITGKEPIRCRTDLTEDAKHTRLRRTLMCVSHAGVAECVEDDCRLLRKKRT